MMTAPRIDWPRLLGDIAYMLGEPDPGNPDVRVPCSQERLASALGVARGTLRGWMDGWCHQRDHCAHYGKSARATVERMCSRGRTEHFAADGFDGRFAAWIAGAPAASTADEPQQDAA